MIEEREFDKMTSWYDPDTSCKNYTYRTKKSFSLVDPVYHICEEFIQEELEKNPNTLHVMGEFELDWKEDGEQEGVMLIDPTTSDDEGLLANIDREEYKLDEDDFFEVHVLVRRGKIRAIDISIVNDHSDSIIMQLID